MGIVFLVSNSILSLSVWQVIVSLDTAHAVAAESEGLARVLYNFLAQSSAELSLKKVSKAINISGFH